MVNGPVAIAPYFSRRIALANGLLFTASGIGSAVGPMLAQFSIDLYGVPQVFLPMGAYALQICIGAALFRPVSFWRKVDVPPRKLTSQLRARMFLVDRSVLMIAQ